jgi:membrane protease YdiL (CAAX protease family)
LIAEAGLLRLALALLLAAGTALVVDRWTAERGFLPPGFARAWRRWAALAVVAGILFLGVFLPVALLGVERAPLSLEDLTTLDVFLLQGLLLLSVVLWFLLGFAGTGAGTEAAAGPGGLAGLFARQLGLRTRAPWADLGIGAAAGAAGWVLVVLLMLAVVAIVWALGGEEILPTEPPELIPWVVGLPILVRAAIGVTAGVVEETFFRGFLQPRVGVLLSSALFVLAHLSYDQPFMLVGIAALSLLFAWLVRWRRSILPAIVAHAVFDLIQLLIVVPQILKRLPEVAG